MAQLKDTTILNTEGFKNVMFDILNKEMLEAAEPVIQEALKKAEKEMRAKLAQKIISVIESDYSIEKMQNRIVITVKQAEKDGRPFL